MTSPERFYGKEGETFETAFPEEEIRDFQKIDKKNPNEAWVDIFDALRAFGFPEIKPEGKSYVIGLISSGRFGSEINMRDSETGVQIHRGNIVPLLRASYEIIFQCSSQWEDQEITNSSAPRNDIRSSRDWQK